MDSTYPQMGLSRILLVLVVIAIFVFAVLGGRYFEQVVASQHFWDSKHACDNEAKQAALDPHSWWRWIYECTDNDGIKYRVETKTIFGVVILVVLICSLRGKKTLFLVTGYKK